MLLDWFEIFRFLIGMILELMSRKKYEIPILNYLDTLLK